MIDPNKLPCERRLKERYSSSEVLFIEMLSCLQELEGNTEIVAANTIDLSAEGLQIKSSNALRVGMIFDFCIQLESVPRKFLLTGEVRWVSELPNGEYKAGIFILDGVETDYEAWVKLFL